MNDTQIRERLAKIQALFAGATCDGERDAAEAALRRIQLKMDRARGPVEPIEFRFSLSNPWSLRLFTALCRSKGLKPYRYARMRRTSLCVRVEPSLVDHELWPEFREMDEVLTQYLGELADHIIAECINPDRSDAEVVAGLPSPSSTAERSG
ncbi:MAG: hypothetical protein H0W72_17365 [Planctomycetes bacterium]|nr:hypothetical protein [Planctomycetota bacterium]